ncbi:SIR2 family NAD-dependent protein deacylase [Thalassobaculum litoreum]|uniref:SIR2-like domain-containing protein n=1 Tax=Thalassobaculum litoreum DSM 18839 TaxID=1123362 RepID=A0A8G2EX94_9PROT|nr:SIR2 family protein [Thalassobaculum litoreum]SDG57704.1 SIR2-like domain-containing protein [Thalassobaculum litoreum DSM 18839]
MSEQINTNGAYTPTAAGTSLSHDPYRRVTDILQRLSPGRMRIAFLLGAGCPLSIRDGGKPLIPDIAGLTEEVKSALLSDASTKAVTEGLWARVEGRGINNPTIEDLLSHTRTLLSLCGENGNGVDSFSKAELQAFDQGACTTVRTAVSTPLPAEGTPYHILASWIQSIPREHPVEIFTTNYDELMEQALENRGVPYFDGFVGSASAFLDLDSMVEDDLPSRWARLWKMHGSINWWLTKDDHVRRSRDRIDGEQLLIYPSHLKYDQSRQMPYLAMLDRLRVFLRAHQSVVVTCGYSFVDEHINAYLVQGLAGNPNASCLALIWGDLSSVPDAVALARRHANLTVMAADGGVIGTVKRDWSYEHKDNNPAYEIAVTNEALPNRSDAPDGQCKWLLGDFAAFGSLLASQLSDREAEAGPAI